MTMRKTLMKKTPNRAMIVVAATSTKKTLMSICHHAARVVRNPLSLLVPADVNLVLGKMNRDAVLNLQCARP
jgi:hypothetical protein